MSKDINNYDFNPKIMLTLECFECNFFFLFNHRLSGESDLKRTDLNVDSSYYSANVTKLNFLFL